MPKTNIFVRFLGQNGRIKSILNAELFELKKTSKTGLYKIPKKKICIQIPISSLIVRSCLLRWSLCCVTVLYYDYILEINHTKPQTVYEWFYSVVMILCYLIKIDVGETNGYSLQAIQYAFFFSFFFFFFFFFFLLSGIFVFRN